MELLIKEGIEPQLGDQVYYVNNGTKKSHGDIQVKKTKNDPPEGTLVFNSYLITSDEMEKNPNMKGNYNVPKYIDSFNKKVEPLLVVFNLHIRESLLITDPADKQFFTRSELGLVSGIPSEPGDQDSLEELMTMSDDELKEIFVDVRRVHIGHRFPSIAEIYKVCDLRNPLAYAVSGKLYQKKASDYFYSKIEAF
jgi:hypothetical protein